MKHLVFLVLIAFTLCQTQGSPYPCLEIPGVGCVCGQGYRNLNGFCTPEVSNPTCIAGYVWNGTACAPSDTQTSNTQPCPTGQIISGLTCISVPISPIATSPVCQANELFIAGRCIAPSGNGNCDVGFVWNGTQCISNTGNNLNGNTFPIGPSGQSPSQIVCQSGYYHNCLSCVPFTGVPNCANGCIFNGSTCINLRNAINSLQSNNTQILSNNNNNNNNNQGLSNSNIASVLQQLLGQRSSSSSGSSSNNGGFGYAECPSGYQFDGSTCQPLSDNINLIPRNLFPVGSSERASIQDIICPNNYCYNGQRCIPYSGNSNLGNSNFGNRGQNNCPANLLSSNSNTNQGQNNNNNNNNLRGNFNTNTFSSSTQGGNNVFVPQSLNQNNQNQFQGFSIQSGSSFQGLFNQGNLNTQSFQQSGTQSFQSNSGSTPTCQPGYYWNGANCTSN